MRFSLGLATLCSILTAVSAAPVAPPAFEHILTGTIVTSSSETQSFITSPYGHRLTAAGYVGGNWTTPDGTLVGTSAGEKSLGHRRLTSCVTANVYPNVGGDSGIQDNNGVLHGQSRSFEFPFDASLTQYSGHASDLEVHRRSLRLDACHWLWCCLCL